MNTALVLIDTAASASSSDVVVVATHLHAIHCCFSVLSSAISSRQEVMLHNRTEHKQHGVPSLSFYVPPHSSISPCLPTPFFLPPSITTPLLYPFIFSPLLRVEHITVWKQYEDEVTDISVFLKTTQLCPHVHPPWHVWNSIKAEACN